jgi:RHS repeat-associated protein
MSALARTSESDCRTRTTGENCTASESWTRTKYTYDYDRYSNRWHQNGSFSMQLSFSGNNNRMDSHSYDSAGNLLNDGSHSYFYDAENRLIQVDGTFGTCSSPTTACYVYNASGQRVRKTTGSTSVDYLYDLGGQEITELSSAGAWNRGEVYAGGRHLATYKNGTTNLIHADWLGTERVRTTAAGASCETITSLSFGDGQSTSGSCADPSPMHFTGKERDSESGLDYFGARYDSSNLGRFLSPDEPFSDQNQESPQSWNLYSYARNNPLRFIDADGRACLQQEDGSYKTVGTEGQSCEDAAKEEAGDTHIASAVVTPTDDDRVRMLAGDVSSLTSLSSLSEVGVNGTLWGQAALGLAEIPGAIGGVWSWLRTGAAAGEVLQGLYGPVTRATLEAAASGGGETVRVVCTLDAAPAAGKALSTAAGEGADALANAAGGGSKYVGNIPKALVETMKRAGLAQESTTSMAGATAREIKFLPNATEFVVKFFHPVQ